MKCDCETVLVHGEVIHDLTCSLFDGKPLIGRVKDVDIEITKTLRITRGGIHFHGALVQADSYRVVGGFSYVAVQAIKDNFVVFCVNVPRNRRNLVRNAAKAAGIFEGI